MRLGALALSSCGGSAAIAASVCQDLALLGHSVHLCTLTRAFHAPESRSGVVLHWMRDEQPSDHEIGTIYAAWSQADFDGFLSMLLRVIDQEQLEVVHFHYGVPFACIAQAVKARLGRKAPVIIGTLHGTDVTAYGRMPSMRERLAEALAEANVLTTVSRSHAGLARHLLSLSTPPVVIPNFVNLDRFRTRERSGGRPRIVHVSNFRQVKDPERMARIFIAIREQLDAELWLIGDGPGLDQVRVLLDRNHADDVRYWGIQSDVAPILAQTDLLLMTSVSESFCMAALEAMACGVPVLASNVGGLPEVVEHGVTGYLFPLNGDEQRAVGQAVDLLADPRKQLRLSRAARRRASCFSPSRIVPLYERLYVETLTRQREAMAARVSMTSVRVTSRSVVYRHENGCRSPWERPA